MWNFLEDIPFSDLILEAVWISEGIEITTIGNKFTSSLKPKFKFTVSENIEPLKFFISLNLNKFEEAISDIFIPNEELSEGKHIISIYSENIKKEKSKISSFVFEINTKEVEKPKLVDNYLDYKSSFYFELLKDIKNSFFYVDNINNGEEFNNFCISKNVLNKYAKNGNNKVHVFYKNKFGKYSDEFVFDYNK